VNFSNQQNPGKNVTGIVVVVLLHVLVAYGIVTGLGTRTVAKAIDIVEARLIEEDKPSPPPADLPPPPPPPAITAPPPPLIASVEVSVPPAPPQSNVIAHASTIKPATTELQPTAAAAPPAPPAVAPVKSGHISAVADFGSCDKPEYPRASRRNEEAGAVTAAFLIGIDGRLVDSKVVKSSGFRDLDQATLQGIGKCTFKPGSTDGKPQQSWMQVQYVWTLE
jgi:protein TonB